MRLDILRGLYREQNGLDVSERVYRARGYQPPFDELPWLDEIATT
jgi:hypothetical protein